MVDRPAAICVTRQRFQGKTSKCWTNG